MAKRYASFAEKLYVDAIDVVQHDQEMAAPALYEKKKNGQTKPKGSQNGAKVSQKGTRRNQTEPEGSQREPKGAKGSYKGAKRDPNGSPEEVKQAITDSV